MSQSMSGEKRKWKKIIIRQHESGLSIQSFCRKECILVDDFRYWQSILFPKTISDHSAFPSQKEVHVSNIKDGEIMIEYHNIRIFIDQQFEPSTLKKCFEILLEVLKEVIC